MDYDQLLFSGHAIRQMFQREISKEDVVEVIESGQIIMKYPDDKPYPSCLMLRFVDKRPIHVVLAEDKENRRGIIVTAYVPDPRMWTNDFTSRRNRQ